MLAELTFDADQHHYHVAGERWPSVTEVLDPLLELDGIPRHILAAAAEFGSHVHKACHLFNRDELDWHSLDDRLAPYVLAWKKFLHDQSAVVISSEVRVCHRSLKYAGTYDAIVAWDNDDPLIDIKSGVDFPRTVGPQTEAYKRAEGRLRRKRFAVLLRPDGNYRCKALTNTNDWTIFVSALNIHNFRSKRI